MKKNENPEKNEFANDLQIDKKYDIVLMEHSQTPVWLCFICR